MTKCLFGIIDNTTYSLRNAEHLQQIHASSRLYFDSFLPSTIREWNRLPSDTKSAPSLSSFKYKFEKDLPKIPQYYYCGDRISQILHTRLRTECSILRYYLFKKNLVSDPLCFCGAVENNFHYLMKCQMYNIMRMEMFDTVNRYSDVTETVLLFGDNSLSIESNEAIYRAVHKYIHQTKRFSPRN